MSDDWFWEGNVVLAVARHLQTEGWTVLSIADTASRQRGVDILAECDGRTLAVEVKGYPSENYSDPRRVGEPKTTRPANQASKWFSQALLAAMKNRGETPGIEIAIAFPEFPTYKRLISTTEESLRMLRLGVFLVSADKQVTVILDHVR